MATLTVTDTSVDGGGAAMTLTAAASGGDDFANDGNTVFIVTNSGASVTVTFDSVVNSNYGKDDNVAESVGTETRIFGPFNTTRYGTSVGVTYSDHTNLTVNPFSLPSATLTL